MTRGWWYCGADGAALTTGSCVPAVPSQMPMFMLILLFKRVMAGPRRPACAVPPSSRCLLQLLYRLKIYLVLFSSSFRAQHWWSCPLTLVYLDTSTTPDPGRFTTAAIRISHVPPSCHPETPPSLAKPVTGMRSAPRSCLVCLSGILGSQHLPAPARLDQLERSRFQPLQVNICSIPHSQTRQVLRLYDDQRLWTPNTEI